MCHGRVLNRKINHLHECSLRIVYKDRISSFPELLQKGSFFHYSPQTFKVWQSNYIKFSHVGRENTTYELNLIFLVDNSKYGVNSIRFLASKVWQMVLMEMKTLKSLKDFKMDDD